MISKIRINTVNGTLAKVEFKIDEYYNYHLIDSKNIDNTFISYEQTEKQGFIEVLDIDIDKI